MNKGFYATTMVEQGHTTIWIEVRVKNSAGLAEKIMGGINFVMGSCGIAHAGKDSPKDAIEHKIQQEGQAA